MKLDTSIWIASKSRWAHLTKVIDLPSVPRCGEYKKFNNREVGDYFNWRVTEIYYHENGQIEIWTELLDNIDNRGYSFESEEEFDEYYNAYIAEGWVCKRGPRENTRYKANLDMPRG